MPPRISTNGPYATKFFSGRQYVSAGACWFGAEFKTFDALIHGGTSSLTVDFPSFSFETNVVSNSFSTVFPLPEVSINAVTGTVSTLTVNFPLTTINFASDNISLESSIISISASGSIRQVQSIDVKATAIDISSDGSITGSITIVTPPPDTGDGLDYPVEGDVYIVLNLKTGAHSEYRDGNNNAIATTGELTFSTLKEKNVSDAYILSRSDSDVRLTVKAAENIERTHDLTFNVDDAGNLKNKKLMLAKGIKGTNWQFSVSSPDQAKLEVRSIDLIVNKLKRRV